MFLTVGSYLLLAVDQVQKYTGQRQEVKLNPL